MKVKFIIPALAIAIVGFTACNKEQVVTNPDFDPETNSVKANFVFSVSGTPATRSLQSTVQADGSFRGMEEVKLFPFATDGKYFVNSANLEATKVFDLGALLAQGAITSEKSRRVIELSIPSGTDAMLFYGKAPKGSLSDAEAGKVTYTVDGLTPSAFNFALNNRIGDNLNKYNQTALVISTILNRVMLAEAAYDAGNIASTKWSEIADIYVRNNDADATNDGRALDPLEEILAQVYISLTTISATEYRAGSSAAVLATISQLYGTTKAVADVTPSTDYGILAKNVAARINTILGTYFTNLDSTPAFQPISNIRSSFTENNVNVNAPNVENAMMSDFPGYFGLPKGAAILAWNATDKAFEYVHTNKSLLTPSVNADPSRYQFPAELIYVDNSSIRTANTEKKDNNTDFPQGVTNWDTDSWANWGDWSAVNSTVTSGTRAVAMAQNVNYGVALLESTVGIKSNTTALQDNKQHFFENEDNNSIALSDLDLTLTGVLVGGQNQNVDWQFLPVASSANDLKVIYDSNVGANGNGIAVPTTAGGKSDANYTLVFDNYVPGDTQTNEVRIALEFKNNGADFWGRDNLVRKDGTFYLLGRLVLDDKTISDWDPKYQVPPVNASGVSQKITRIFTQDFKTVANFQLTETSLQGAYVTVPDLRSTALTFGLSVDIVWRNGLSFDVELGSN